MNALCGVALSWACTFPDYGFAPMSTPTAGAAGTPPEGGSAGSTGGVSGRGGETTGTTGGAAGEAAGGAAGGGGEAPAPPPRCQSLFEADSSLPSGGYELDADGEGPLAPFMAYCDMQSHGGGWTLIGSFLDTTFNATAMGSSSELCYDTACVNRAYAALPLELDLRIDAAQAAISGDAVDSTAIFQGIDASSTGHTLRTIFTAGVPAYVEGPTTTVEVEWFKGLACDSWANYGAGLCESGVHVVFAIPSGCPDGPLFALGVANNFEGTGSFCDGWPQLPGTNFPKAIRVWAR